MSQSRRGPGPFFVLVVLLVVVGAVWSTWRIGPFPEITIESSLPGIGKRTAITVLVREPRRGLGDVRVELIQGEREELLAERTHAPRANWAFWGERVRDEEIVVEVGSETIKGLREGPATIRVTAERAGSWLRHPSPVVSESELPVRLRPPALQLRSSQVYVKQGGCEVVVYEVGESAVADGVQAGAWWFPGYPLPGGSPRERFALFAAPYDESSSKAIRLVARDEVGNEAQAAFIDQFFSRPLSRDTIQLDEGFLERVVPAILSQTPEMKDQGDLLQNYLAINRDLRQKNAATLVDLARASKHEFLWSSTFLPMRNAAVMSGFADRRSYVYRGRTVDQQDHLGFDLASTRMAEIHAANDGVVVLSRYFGIYGNAVVIDHGYGLLTLYGHLSSLGATEGEPVSRGQVIGRSGATGLAGGDHLHFTILLHGLAVDPREWWDGHWLQDRLERKLGAALPWSPTSTR